MTTTDRPLASCWPHIKARKASSLEELAKHMQSLDNRQREENCDLRERVAKVEAMLAKVKGFVCEMAWNSGGIPAPIEPEDRSEEAKPIAPKPYEPQAFDKQEREKELYHVNRGFLRCDTESPSYQKPTYEPATYDEAVAMAKGWKLLTNRYGSLQWQIDKARWWPCADRLPSWQAERWPELLQEMGREEHRQYRKTPALRWEPAYDGWQCRSEITICSRALNDHGTAVCDAYLRFTGHEDWADRLACACVDGC